MEEYNQCHLFCKHAVFFLIAFLDTHCKLLYINICFNFVTGLLTTAMVVTFSPDTGLQGFVFFVAGFICFIPGAYHVVYIYLAVKGKRGFDFYHLPLFN